MPEFRGPIAQSYVERDCQVVSPSYTRGYPFVMARGQGTEVWDVDGNRYLDFSSGVAVTATGHSHPDVVRAIKDQAEKFLHMSGTDFYYPVQIELAEYLTRIAPMSEPSQVFFTNSGAESIEAAIKLALYATNRHYFIAFYGAFHGRTMGALAFTASKPVHRSYFIPTMPSVTHVPYPNPYRPVLSGYGCLHPPDDSLHPQDEGEAVVRYIEEVVLGRKLPSDEVAGILVEPIQGEGGYVVPPPSFFPALRKLCDRHGILLILDEVQSGMGRTGKWFAIEHEGVEPDIIAIAKGIASGLPLGAMIARKSLMTWPSGAHASTFGGNPVSCAASLATLRLLEREMMDNATEMGAYLMRRLREMMTRYPIIGDVRGRGLMVGIEIIKDPVSKARDKVLRDRIVHNAFLHGLLLLGAGPNTVRLVPPLNVTQPQIDEALTILTHVIEAL
ncbi:MAG: acetyl ornithine aminotransferase family protein [Anaerolineae bacterium]|nr:acetyl ornithine aminotransferase family protein [Anaerolineae bacterium]